MAMPRYRRRLRMYWSTKASGELAAHFAITSCWTTPPLVGKSRYSGGFFGFGDHAAADASCARRPKGNLAESAGLFTASSAASLSAFVGPAPRGARQQGLMMYTLPNTSGCFIPIRVAP